MYPENYDIIAVQGDTIRWSKFFIDENTGTTFNFNSNYNVELSVRNGYYPATLIASYSKQILPGMTLTSPGGLTGGIGVASGTTGGTCNFCIGWSFSNEMPTDRMCKYDFKVNNQSTNTITTLLRGNIQILPQVNYIQNLP